MAGMLKALAIAKLNYFKRHIEDLPPQERRVFVALAELWKPATTREIADRARIRTSQCSAQLQRLAARGAVAVDGGTLRRKQYYLVERMYNIYYLLRRGDPGRVVDALLRFMASFYSAPETLNRLPESAPSLRDMEDDEDHGTGVGCWPARSDQALAPYDDVALRYRSSTAPELAAQVAVALAVKGNALLDKNPLDVDRGRCDQDLRTLLAIPQTDDLSPVVVHAYVDAAIGFAAFLEPARALERIQASPAAQLLLPLATALQQESGLNPRVSHEVQEVAQDVRNKLSRTRVASVPGNR